MLDLIQKPKHYSNNIKQHTESFLEVVVVVEDTCCCKVSSVIVNSWHEGTIKFICWGRFYEDRSGCSTSRLFWFYLMYLLVLFMKLTGCFTILEISPSLFFKIWDKTVIMYLAGVLFSNKKNRKSSFMAYNCF